MSFTVLFGKNESGRCPVRFSSDNTDFLEAAIADATRLSTELSSTEIPLEEAQVEMMRAFGKSPQCQDILNTNQNVGV